MFVVFRGDSFAYVGRARSIMLDILGPVEPWKHNYNVEHTAREVLKIVLIRDDFPVPDC